MLLDITVFLLPQTTILATSFSCYILATYFPKSQFNSMSGISRRQMCGPSTSRCGDFLLLGTILNIFGPYQAIFEVGLRSTNLFLGFTQVHSFQT